MTPPTEGERAAFEAGVKFGTLYHQFAGTPVSPASAGSLATAMEAAVENQPFCTDVSVTVDDDRLAAEIGGGVATDGGDGEDAADDAEREDAAGDGADPTDDGDGGDDGEDDAPGDVDGRGQPADEPTEATDVADYAELTGTLFDATVTVQRGGYEVRAAMETEDDYPLMRITDVRRPE